MGEFSPLPVESPGFPSSSGETSLLVDVRHGVHQGFERLVFEFEEGTDLQHFLEYVDEAIPPSGNPVDVAGDVIVELVMVEDFEGVLTWAIGLRGETRAVVTTLQEPHRLVLDLQTD